MGQPRRASPCRGRRRPRARLEVTVRVVVVLWCRPRPSSSSSVEVTTDGEAAREYYQIQSILPSVPLVARRGIIRPGIQRVAPAPERFLWVLSTLVSLDDLSLDALVDANGSLVKFECEPFPKIRKPSQKWHSLALKSRGIE